MRFYSFYISIHVCHVIFFNFHFNSHHVTLLTGKEHNFNKYEDDYITDLNTPYDYESIMHYRPLSFNKNETVPTISTTIPYLNEVIGQRFDFSALDIIRLNLMYDCGECPHCYRETTDLILC